MKRNNLHTTIEINYPCMAKQPRIHILRIVLVTTPEFIFHPTCADGGCECFWSWNGMMDETSVRNSIKHQSFDTVITDTECSHEFFSFIFLLFSCEYPTSVAKMGKGCFSPPEASNQINWKQIERLNIAISYELQPADYIDLEMIDGE